MSPKSDPRIIELLARRFPRAFFVNGERRRPLKIGIIRDLVDADIGIPGTQLRQALAVYTNAPGYLRACREGRYVLILRVRRLARSRLTRHCMLQDALNLTEIWYSADSGRLPMGRRRAERRPHRRLRLHLHLQDLGGCPWPISGESGTRGKLRQDDLHGR
jgi:RNA chaperone ProQ/FINO-like protein